MLSYWISTALADFAIASIVISGMVTTVLVAGVDWLDRRRWAGDAPPVTVGCPGAPGSS